MIVRHMLLRDRIEEALDRLVDRVSKEGVRRGSGNREQEKGLRSPPRRVVACSPQHLKNSVEFCEVCRRSTLARVKSGRFEVRAQVFDGSPNLGVIRGDEMSSDVVDRVVACNKRPAGRAAPGDEVARLLQDFKSLAQGDPRKPDVLGKFPCGR